MRCKYDSCMIVQRMPRLIHDSVQGYISRLAAATMDCVASNGGDDVMDRSSGTGKHIVHSISELPLTELEFKGGCTYCTRKQPETSLTACLC